MLIGGRGHRTRVGRVASGNALLGGFRSDAQAVINALTDDGVTLSADQKTAINDFYITRADASWGDNIKHLFWLGGQVWAGCIRDWENLALDYSGGYTTQGSGVLNAGSHTPSATYIDLKPHFPDPQTQGFTDDLGGFFFTNSTTAPTGPIAGEWDNMAEVNGSNWRLLWGGRIARAGTTNARDGTFVLPATALGGRRRAVYRATSAGSSHASNADYTDGSALPNSALIFGSRYGAGSPNPVGSLASAEVSIYGAFVPSASYVDTAAVDAEMNNMNETIRTLAVALGHTALP